MSVTMTGYFLESKQAALDDSSIMSSAMLRHDFVVETEGSTNYARLAYLILQEGTHQIRVNCMRNIVDDMSLTQILAIKKNDIQALKKKKVINDFHLDILYPQNSLEPRVEDIDMTLWILVIRNITKGKNQINWTRPPTVKDTRWQHQALRLKEVRNRLFHLPLPELSRAEFRELWDIATGALSALGTSHEVINDYYTKDLDPLQTKTYTLQVREQVLEELYGVMMSDGQRRKQLKIMIPLVICVALLISVVFVVPLVIFLRGGAPCSKAIQGIQTDLGWLQFLPRAGWGAEMPKHPLDDLHTPVDNVVIMHTAMITQCTDIETCCGDVKKVQHYHMHVRDPPFNDIAYSFLVGGDGVIYEGTGWNKVSYSIPGKNKKLISLAFMGHYMYSTPPAVATIAARVFIGYMVKKHKVSGNYSLYAHCQLNPRFPDSPGVMLIDLIRKWDGFNDANLTNCEGVT